VQIPERSTRPIDETIWRQAAQLRGQHREALGEARSLTRFLCGVTSPRLSRAKLSSHALFGALDHVPFGQVLQRAECYS
jgi:ATP-dependent DNA helicase RecQ